MKATQGNLSLSVLTLAVRGALAAMAAMPLAAMADSDETAADQINPTNTIEVGANITSNDSAKFGEYNGLDKKGVEFTGSVNLKGGDAYGQGTGTRRWTVTGTDLGSSSRQLGATVGDQGKWSLGIDYDELRHNIDDTYQTPYQGAMGGNLFTLPASFGVINYAKPSGTPTPPYGAQALTASQLAAFHKQDVYSKRDTTSLSAGMNIDPQWGLTFDYKHIDQSGAKLIGSGTDKLTDSVGVWGFERVAILLNPTNAQTDNFNLALNWKGDRSYFSAGYYGSLYHDEYNGLSYSNPWMSSASGPKTGVNPGEAFPIGTMSTPPSNEFHQLNLTGGYSFSPATKLAGGVSYARNTQNESYAGSFTPGTATLPANSLDASVTMKHADLKLTNRMSDALNLAAGLTYNERDNHTSSKLYPFLTLGGDPVNPVNIPESWKHTQFDLSGDYRIDTKQRVHAGYSYDKFERWCNTDPALYAAGREAPIDGSTPLAATGCTQVPQETTNALAIDYKLKASETVNVKAGYAYSKRNADINPAYYSPLQSFEEGYENKGFLAFFQASRKENAVKLSADWQASDKLDVTLSGKYAKDDYDVTLGVQQGKSDSINLDATYAVSENASVNAFVTSQHRTRDMTNGNGRLAGSLATADWTNNLTDNQLMMGLGSKQKGLMGGKLELSEDLTYSLGKTDYSTGAGPGYTCTVGAAPAFAATCGAYPTIKSENTTLKLSGSYKVSKPAKIVLSYQYQHMKTTDPYYYAGYQYGYVSGTGVLPSFQQAPSYNVSEIFVAYNYSFK